MTLRYKLNASLGFQVLLALAICAAPVQAKEPPDVSGTWLGKLKTPVVELRLGLEITRRGARLGGVLTSIDQGGQRIALDKLTLDRGRRLRFAIKALKASFSGAHDPAKKTISGVFSQGGANLPLTFERVARLPALRKPQEPKKPYPYRAIEVAYHNVKAGVRLAGTLTLPRGKGPFPAVVLLSGSGAQDRDEALLGHRPFLVLADHLTRKGIAVLRSDDRGVGGSTGDLSKSTLSDLADDALAAVTLLRARPEVDPRRVGILGHSEGGLVAPLAATRSKAVRFLVLLAAPGVTGEKLIERQQRLLGAVEGMSSEVLALHEKINAEVFAVLKKTSDPRRTRRTLRRLLRRAAKALQKRDPDALKVPPEVWVEKQLAQAAAPAFRYFLFFDPAPVLKKVRCPVLALNGALDLQVDPKQNLPAVAAALHAGGNRRVTVKELPGLNHLLQTAKTGAVAEYARIEQTMAPAALGQISTWILREAR